MKYILALAACLVCLSSAPAQDLFLNISNSGCAPTTAPGYAGQDLIDAYSVGGSTTSTAVSAGKLTLSDFVIQKSVDTCSVPLITSFLTSQVIPTLVLSQVKLVGNVVAPHPTLTITLQGATIDSYNLSDSGNSDGSSEKISFKYQTLKIVTYKQDSQGNATATPATTATYDLNLNRFE